MAIKSLENHDLCDTVVVVNSSADTRPSEWVLQSISAFYRFQLQATRPVDEEAGESEG